MALNGQEFRPSAERLFEFAGKFFGGQRAVLECRVEQCFRLR